MSIYRRALGLALPILFAVAGSQCQAAGDCLRFSDCAQGLTCFDGKCVAEPSAGGAEEDAAQDGAAEATSTDAGAEADAPAASEGGDACVGCTTTPEASGAGGDATND